MDKEELLIEIRKLHEEKRKISERINLLNTQLDDIEKSEAGREYLRQEEILSTFAT